MSVSMIFLVVGGFILFRNYYTSKIQNTAIKIITMYTKYLIQNNQYDIGINYFEKIPISYFRYFFSIWNWKVKNIIKPEYREILKQFKEVK